MRIHIWFYKYAYLHSIDMHNNKQKNIAYCSQGQSDMLIEIPETQNRTRDWQHLHASQIHAEVAESARGEYVRQMQMIKAGQVRISTSVLYSGIFTGIYTENTSCREYPGEYIQWLSIGANAYISCCPRERRTVIHVHIWALNSKQPCITRCSRRNCDTEVPSYVCVLCFCFCVCLICLSRF